MEIVSGSSTSKVLIISISLLGSRGVVVREGAGSGTGVDTGEVSSVTRATEKAHIIRQCSRKG